MNTTYNSRVRGSLLGGAIGDQLGAGVEFESIDRICELYGPAGVTGFVPAYGREKGRFTDDTQLTLFVAEGLIRADNQAWKQGDCDPLVPLTDAHLRWLHTQLLPSGGAAAPGLSANPVVEAVILQVRMPRVLLAFLVGAALTVSGSALQAFFRNPLVSPYILGLSSGAAFGAALA
ncbi:MAG: iron chelate uptake ABC transporter family permease subunit, partial [Gemmatimonadota bacterium]